MARRSSLRSKEVSPPPLKRKRIQLSCDPCRQNKRKCDRKLPCGQCKADKELLCTFQRANITQSIARNQDFSMTFDDVDDHDDLENNIINTTSLPTSGQNSLFTSSSEVEATSNSTSPITLNESLHPDLSILSRYIDHPEFLNRIFNLYMDEIEWIEGLLNDTRIFKIIKRNPLQPRLSCSNLEWEVIHILVYSMIALTAQMCKNEFEIVLVQINSEMANSIDFNFIQCWSAEKFSQISNNCMLFYLNQEDLEQNSRFWPAEHFSALFLYRMFQKNIYSQKESHLININLMIDIQRLRLAGIQFEPRLIEDCHKIIGRGLHPKEERLLTYRIFWTYFEKERFIGWSSNTGYTIDPKHCSICVRGCEDGEHYSIGQICRNDDKIEERDCICHLQNDIPTLSVYQIVKVQIFGMLGYFYDRLGAIKKKSFKWPSDAKEITDDLENQVNDLYIEIEKYNLQNKFQPRQVASLHLILAYSRSMMAKSLLNRFIDKMNDFQTNQFDSTTTSWLLEKRLNDARMALLRQGRQSLSMLNKGSVSWIFGPKFVFMQLIAMVESIEKWFCRIDTEEYLPINYASEQTNSHLLQCLYACMDARNSLILLNRGNTLYQPKVFIRTSCDSLSNLFIKAGLLKEGHLPACIQEVGNVDELIDLNEFKKMINDKFQRRVREINSNGLENVYPISTSDWSQNDISLNLDQIFAEFPSLENLLNFIEIPLIHQGTS